MYQILVLDNGPLDREITCDILSTGLWGSEIRSAADVPGAVKQLQQKPADLLLACASFGLAALRELATAARKRCPSVSLLLTSIHREEELPGLVLKLGGQGYLLKPFRPAQLLSAVAPLMEAAVAPSFDEGSHRRNESLSHLAAAIKEGAYKKCIDISKEYIDFLYDSADNKEDIRANTVKFAEGIAELGNDFSPELRWKLTGYLERFRSRYDLQGKRYETCSILEEMLDAIFEEMDSGACYFDDDLKKVLNYIDRNIKRGINLDSAAEYVSMSSCYFSKFFKKELGINFITYVTDRKLEYAKEMLCSTDMPVINIAYELSYNETNYFSKVFKKKVGVTPTEYREHKGVLIAEQAVDAG